MVNMDNLNNYDNKKEMGGNQQGNTFQGENKKDATASKSGCGCGCKSAPMDEEVVDIEEEDWNY